MRADLPSGTVTFLFTDVEGSTRLLHELGAAAYAEALAEHRRVIREACVGQGGVEVDTQGDAFFFAFPSAPGALGAARAFTEALSDGPIQVRVGLHTGRPLVTEEGYVGDDVHVAARVAASSHGGQVVLSEATARAAEPSGSEPQALPLLDLGEHRLKDVADVVSIFQLGEESFPPLKTISNTNLPRPASSFVGRERELAEVLSRIEGGARLLTLTGPGGSGKTRLAIEAAASLVPEYKAGVFWVALASLRDAALVTEQVAQTLGAKDGLAEHIGEREMLLLLDNLEQVIEAAPELASLLERCTNLTLLVTSRELLRVRGEVEYPVPPLAEPEAVMLFCERSGLEPSEEISQLCARLDSLPLAVELAAARTKALSPAQILERIAQRLDLLRGGRDTDPRQQTLRATIEWSYDLLSPDEQQLFSRLSVFAGGCTLEAAERVCDADLDTLQSLVEKSLLRFTDGRYWMLETIREYALERLAAQRGETVGTRRHGQYFAALARDVENSVDGRERLTIEHYNLRAALEWAIENEPTLGLDFAESLSNYWLVLGFLSEARRFFEAALIASDPRSPSRASVLGVAGETATLQGDYEEARQFLEEAIAVGADGDFFSVARARNALGILAGLEGDAAEAAREFDEAVQLARGVGDELLESYCLSNLGRAFFEMGAEDRARESLDACARLCEGHASRRPLGMVANTRARIAFEHGDYREAARLVGESLSIATEYADRWLAAEAFEVLSVSVAAMYEPERAGMFWGAAEALRTEIGAPLPTSAKRWLDRGFRMAGTRETEAFEAGVRRGRGLALSEALTISASIH